MSSPAEALYTRRGLAADIESVTERLSDLFKGNKDGIDIIPSHYHRALTLLEAGKVEMVKAIIPDQGKP